jgi:hypothetical protein
VGASYPPPSPQSWGPAGPPRRRRGSIVFPSLLIVVGGLLLLQNLGILSGSIWGTLWRFWPVVLILLGLEVLLGGRGRGGVLVVIAGILLIGGAIASGGRLAGVAGFAPTPPTETKTASQPLNGATQSTVSVDFAAGRLTLGALDNPTDQLASTVLTAPGDQHRPVGPEPG